MSKTTDYPKIALHAKESAIYDANNRYICEVSHTKRHLGFIDNADWDLRKESWLEYRTRIKPEIEAEQAKRNQLAQDICNAYNEKFVKQ